MTCHVEVGEFGAALEVDVADLAHPATKPARVDHDVGGCRRDQYITAARSVRGDPNTSTGS